MTTRSTGPVAIGIDIGTTSVKGLAVKRDGAVLDRIHVPHRVIVDAPDRLEHDARQAWRSGPSKAFKSVSGQARAQGLEVAGVCVSSMVPSLTAVNRRGVPLIPGLLYGDVRGRLDEGDDATASIAMRDCEGFLRWAISESPGAAGYWPAQAVATYAIAGVPAIDTAMTASLGSLHHWGKWDEGYLDAAGADISQMPEVVPMGQSAGTVPGTGTHITGGTVDAFCDQIVAGASQVGDVLVILGATLIIWIVVDTWMEVPGLWTVPHTVPERILVGGPSNAGALFVDWARKMTAGMKKHGAVVQPTRSGDSRNVPVWLPYLRGERVPFHNTELRSSLHDLNITSGPVGLERAAYEASGFVVRRMLHMAGVKPRRIVASGGGSRVLPWMAAIADATDAPVDSVLVPEGAALGAAYLGRMAAGLETDLDGADSWARVGRRTEPDAEWVKSAKDRYARFVELMPFDAETARPKRG